MFSGLITRFQSPLTRFRSDYEKLVAATGSVPTTVAGLNDWGRSLDDLEHAIYDWFNSDPAPNEPDRIEGAALLDLIQQQHLTYIRAVRATPAAAPYATDLDADETAPDGSLQHQLTWDLLEDRFGLSVNEGGLDGFGDEVAAMHARLLSRPQGRHLIRDLMKDPVSADNPTVTIDGISLARLARVENALRADLPPGETMEPYHEHAQAGPVAAHGRSAADAEATFTATGAVAGQGATTGVAIEQQYRDSTSALRPRPVRSISVRSRRPSSSTGTN